MGPICCPETSVMTHHSTLRKIPEEHRSDLHHGGRLKSPNLHYIYSTTAAQTARLFNTKRRITQNISSRKPHCKTSFCSSCQSEDTRLQVHRMARVTLNIVIVKHLPATMGLPRCAKLSVCKNSSTYALPSYADSDTRKFKENLKN
jgi:hypothetical protein